MTDFMSGQYREDLGSGAKDGIGKRIQRQISNAKAGGEGALSTNTYTEKFLVPMF
jgi:hypothetical protein